MKIYLATDHAGFELKEKIKSYLVENGFEVEDCGAQKYEEGDDYPDFISKAAKSVSQNPEEDKAIVFGSSGQGEAIVANKFKGIRAVVYYGPVTVDHIAKIQKDPFEDLKVVKLSRKHNNANVLSLGARFLTEDMAIKAVKLWLETPFSNEERHVRRINKIAALEKEK